MRRLKHLGHSSKGEPFNQGHSREYREGYDNIKWGPDFSGTNGRIPLRDRHQQHDPGNCVLCESKLVDGGIGMGVYCPNEECFNRYRGEEEDAWDPDSATTG